MVFVILVAVLLIAVVGVFALSSNAPATDAIDSELVLQATH